MIFLTLLKSVFGSLHTYYMYVYKVLIDILFYLESLGSKFFFFMGANTKEKKMTWVSWENVFYSKQDGSLGVNSYLLLLI